MKKKVLLFLFLMFSLLMIYSSDKKHSLTIKETTFPLIPAMSEFKYTRTHSNPFGISFIDTGELSFWYLAASAYFNPLDFVEVGTLYQFSVLENDKVHLDLGIGTAVSMDNNINFSVPFISLANLDYYLMEDFFYISSINRFFVYGAGFIFKTELPVTYEINSGQWVFNLGPGFNYGYSSVIDYAAWAYTVNLGVNFCWGGEV